jgi:hypothetical protein
VFVWLVIRVQIRAASYGLGYSILGGDSKQENNFNPSAPDW